MISHSLDKVWDQGVIIARKASVLVRYTGNLVPGRGGLAGRGSLEHIWPSTRAGVFGRGGVRTTFCRLVQYK